MRLFARQERKTTRYFQRAFESAGQYHGFWAVVLLRAPDQFRVSWSSEKIDQKQALEDCYETLRTGFKFVEKRIKDDRLLGVLRELIEMAFEAYRAGDQKRGNRLLQECEGLIWPSQSFGTAFAGEAERRAFGDVVLFPEAKPPKFDREGTANDLGPRQRLLLNYVDALCASLLDAKVSFEPMTHVLNRRGEIEQIKQRSRKKTMQVVAERATEAAIDASATTELGLSGGSGNLIHDLEERGLPRVSVTCLVEDYRVQTFRYHLEDPKIFPLPSAGN
jgi:hypothetical protein